MASASALIFEAHGRCLRLLAAAGGQHFEGLSQASRRSGLPSRLRRQLRELDAAAAFTRHITVPRVEQLLDELTCALKEVEVDAEITAASGQPHDELTHFWIGDDDVDGDVDIASIATYDPYEEVATQWWQGADAAAGLGSHQEGELKTLPPAAVAAGVALADDGSDDATTVTEMGPTVGVANADRAGELAGATATSHGRVDDVDQGHRLANFRKFNELARAGKWRAAGEFCQAFIKSELEPPDGVDLGVVNAACERADVDDSSRFDGQLWSFPGCATAGVQNLDLILGELREGPSELPCYLSQSLCGQDTCLLSLLDVRSSDLEVSLLGLATQIIDVLGAFDDVSDAADAAHEGDAAQSDSEDQDVEYTMGAKEYFRTLAAVDVGLLELARDLSAASAEGGGCMSDSAKAESATPCEIGATELDVPFFIACMLKCLMDVCGEDILAASKTLTCKERRQLKRWASGVHSAVGAHETVGADVTVLLRADAPKGILRVAVPTRLIRRLAGCG